MLGKLIIAVKIDILNKDYKNKDNKKDRERKTKLYSTFYIIQR
jgi:hypothetical protein